LVRLNRRGERFPSRTVEIWQKMASTDVRAGSGVVVSTDYPHPDGAFTEAMNEFLALPLDDAARRKILWDNCARLYDIPKPAAPLTRAAPSAAAAQ
jgi:predicted TIM-barrel fold metal-dependent hydrolase